MTPVTTTQLESLLRGEIAAAETYKQVLSYDEETDTQRLHEICSEHGDAIRFFLEQLSKQGVVPPTGSGVWGFFARAVEGTAKLFGDKAALAALREGEVNGLQTYENALVGGELNEECQKHVESVLIPAQRRHVEALQAMIDAL